MASSRIVSETRSGDLCGSTRSCPRSCRSPTPPWNATTSSAALQPFIKADAGDAVDLGGAVELTHLRHEQLFSGSVALDDDTGEVQTIYSGTGKLHEPVPDPLSAIIQKFNTQYGTDFSDADQLVFEAAAIDLVGDPNVQQQTTNNTPENFAVVFPKMFQDALLGRIDRDEKTVYKFLDHQQLAADLSKLYGTLVQAQAKIAYQEHCPIGSYWARTANPSTWSTRPLFESTAARASRSNPSKPPR
ncbi:MAG: hypothetical protein ACR2G2_15395 [Pseudonocardia sp.]